MRRSSAIRPVVISAIVLAVILVPLCLLWGPQMAHALYRMFTAGLFVVVPLFVGAVLLIAASVTTGAARGTSVAVLVLGALATTAFAWVPHNYQVDRHYVGDVKMVNHTAPSFGDRAPYQVASTSSTKNLGNTTGQAESVKSLNDQADNGLWTALVVRRGVWVGYESVQVQDMPLFGQTEPDQVTTCAFPKTSSLRIGGSLPKNSLTRAIYAATPPAVKFDAGDAYGYCDGKSPKVVVPLTEVKGAWTVSEDYFGDAVYDGKTGKVTIVTDSEKVNAIPGPVYPQSLAARQRTALTALGSFSDYFFHRTGYETTADDSDNPDSFNPTEIGLRQVSNDHATYVTPLTPPGSSTSVVALSVVDASTGKTGDRNTLTVFKYADGHARQANSSVASNIKQSTSWLPDWASGIKIFEIVPGKKDEWVASIGQSQGVVYRAVIDAKGKATLYDESGDVVTRTGAQTPSNGDTDGDTTGAANGDLSKMTPAQLQNLADRVLSELTKRAESAPTPTSSPTPKSK
ncbi:hypothetical protein [Curtobacterium sp. MCSS17_016]|uniref:hypothetical protein n=1 Tax=Curtobacterium sp. MCSS17_016 TaxID=2175644 RepID=UPI000DAA8A53|nr:hypothetical protein [Curtobacterium sp. MCSS17_016]WIE81084.1 hypothetical protein DEJ19_021645 [Curtobacterium sp. MCSS17_016]